jgi:type VI secretion system protein ImpF
MARAEAQQGLMPSLIDRLIDPDSAGTAWRHGYGQEQMTATVQRDLEDLLNTRQTHAGMPDQYIETRRSVLGYGLPDLTSLNALTIQQRQEIARAIEASITLFEPRLRDVHAVLVDGADVLARSIKFRIDARLRVDPAPEVAFDTILELTTGQYSVKQGDT